MEKQCEVRHGKEFGEALYEVVALSPYCLCFSSILYKLSFVILTVYRSLRDQ